MDTQLQTRTNFRGGAWDGHTGNMSELRTNVDVAGTKYQLMLDSSTGELFYLWVDWVEPMMQDQPRHKKVMRWPDTHKVPVTKRLYHQLRCLFGLHEWAVGIDASPLVARCKHCNKEFDVLKWLKP